MSKIYENVPYEDIEKYVELDLKQYDQENSYPASKTVVLPDGTFRHYELGSIIGYVLFGKKDENGKVRTFISQIEEDDEFWFAPSRPMYMSGFWINSAIRTFERMQKWYKEHIFEGFVDGKWQNKIIKEIVEEEFKGEKE